MPPSTHAQYDGIPPFVRTLINQMHMVLPLANNYRGEAAVAAAPWCFMPDLGATGATQTFQRLRPSSAKLRQQRNALLALVSQLKVSQAFKSSLTVTRISTTSV